MGCLGQASLVAQLVKNLPAEWETWIQSLGWEDPLGKGKASQSSILGQVQCTSQLMGLIKLMRMLIVMMLRRDHYHCFQRVQRCCRLFMLQLT